MVVGSRVNRGPDDGIENIVEYRFFGNKRALYLTETQIKQI